MTLPTWHQGATARGHMTLIAEMYEQLPDSTEVALPLGVIRAALAGDWDARDPMTTATPADASRPPDGGLAAGTAARCAVCQVRITWVPYDEAGRHWNQGEAGRWVDPYGSGTGNPTALDSHRHRPAEAVGQ